MIGVQESQENEYVMWVVSGDTQNTAFTNKREVFIDYFSFLCIYLVVCLASQVTAAVSAVAGGFLVSYLARLAW